MLHDYKGDICDDFVNEPGDEPGMEIRLRVTSGGWSVLSGDPSYDQDHRGFWGASYLTRKTNCRDLARELIEEARSDHAMSGE